jgi:sulfite exporter TauE/SafE
LKAFLQKYDRTERDAEASRLPLRGISFFASAGHVVTSIVIGAIIAAVGLQFRKSFETQQGHIVRVILVATGIGLLILGLARERARPHSRGWRRPRA